MSGLAPSVLLQVVPLPDLGRPVIMAVAILYFVVVTAIGAWALGRTRTRDDFFIAGKRIGLLALSLSAMAATLSGFTFIGGPGLVYSRGLGALYIVLPAGVTGAMVAWALAKRLRLLGEARNLITIPDAVGARYDSAAAQGLSGAAVLIGVVGYVATNFLALGVVIDGIFGVGLNAAIWIGAAVVLAYTVAGGMIAGVYTDVIQGALMAVASVLVFAFCLESGGGLGGLSRSILAEEAAFLGPWGSAPPLAALSFYFVFGLGTLGQPQVLHKFYMLEDPRRLKWYPVLMTGALVVTTLVFFGVGIATKAAVADGVLAPLSSPDQATPAFLLRFTPLLLAGIVIAGVSAAIMSTVNAFVNIGAAAVVHDLPVAFGRLPPDGLAGGRLATVGITTAAALTAQLSGSLVAFLGIFGWGLFASTLVPALAVGLNWEGATRAGAVASIASGLGLTLSFECLAYFGIYSFPAGITVSGVTLVASTLVFFLVSRLTHGGAGEDIDPDVRMIMRM